MDGKALLYDLRHLLREDSDSGFLDDYTSYRWLNEAALDLQLRTRMLKTSTDLTTVDGTAAYYLPADYLGLYMRDTSNRYIAKFTDDDDNVSWLQWKPYEEIIYENQTDEVAIPTHFSVYDYGSQETQVTGTATSTAAAAAGEAKLTDTSALFTTTERVSPHDIIHNTADTSVGVILSITDATNLQCALFGGTANDWTSTDTYVINPQGRLKAILQNTPSTDDYTATIHYLKRPAPVYSDYGTFGFPEMYTSALVKYAAWLYKYRDDEPNYGDKWYLYYDNMVRKYSESVDHIQRRKHFRVNLKRRQ